jgi:hypothetical protein
MGEGLSSFIKDNMSGQPAVSQSENASTDQIYISDAIEDGALLNELDSDYKPEVVVLIGFPEVGKTSFVSTCYQLLLQNGKIDDYTFYDSDTFVGFERRVFARRFSQFNNISFTKRTVITDAHLLTLYFSHPQKGKRIFVFSDLSGEVYEQYAYQEGAVAADQILQNADRLLLFINSDDLVTTKYMSVYDQYETLLDRMTANKIPSNITTIDIVFNKSDLITENNLKKFESNKREMIDLFGKKLHNHVTNEYSIISNNIENSSSLISLLHVIVNETSETKKVTDDFANNLDWVKELRLNK